MVLRLEPGSTLRTRLPYVVLLDGTRLPRGSNVRNPASIRGSTKLNPAAIAAIVVLRLEPGCVSGSTQLNPAAYTNGSLSVTRLPQAELESQGEA